MDAVTTIERYWYSLIAIPLGIIGIIYVFLPMFRARAAARLNTRAYFARSALVALVSGALVGGVAVPLLDPEILQGFIIGLLLVGVIFMWILMFEHNAPRS